MDSFELYYISSDDELVFERNQRLIKEYHEEEDQCQVRDHLTRVLDEVKEGKRKTLRIDTFPKPSNIPLAIPLDRTLAVTVAFKPGDLVFNIMSQGSQTGSLSPLPAITAQPLPYRALLYQSTVTNITQISTLLKKHGLKISSDLTLRVPASFERSCHPPRGTEKLQYSAWSQEHLKTGALLPQRPYFKNYLNYMQIAPFQLQTNSYRILCAMRSLYHIQHWVEPTHEEISYLLALKRTPLRTEGDEGFYYLASWP